MADTWQNFQRGKKTGQYNFHLTKLEKMNSRMRYFHIPASLDIHGEIG
jgi:hypothetical protein